MYIFTKQDALIWLKQNYNQIKNFFAPFGIKCIDAYDISEQIRNLEGFLKQLEKDDYEYVITTFPPFMENVHSYAAMKNWLESHLAKINQAVNEDEAIANIKPQTSRWSYLGWTLYAIILAIEITNIFYPVPFLQESLDWLKTLIGVDKANLTSKVWPYLPQGIMFIQGALLTWGLGQRLINFVNNAKLKLASFDNTHRKIAATIIGLILSAAFVYACYISAPIVLSFLLGSLLRMAYKMYHLSVPPQPIIIKTAPALPASTPKQTTISLRKLIDSHLKLAETAHQQNKIAECIRNLAFISENFSNAFPQKKKEHHAIRFKKKTALEKFKSIQMEVIASKMKSMTTALSRSNIDNTETFLTVLIGYFPTTATPSYQDAITMAALAMLQFNSTISIDVSYNSRLSDEDQRQQKDPLTHAYWQCSMTQRQVIKQSLQYAIKKLHLTKEDEPLKKLERLLSKINEEEWSASKAYRRRADHSSPDSIDHKQVTLTSSPS